MKNAEFFKRTVRIAWRIILFFTPYCSLLQVKSMFETSDQNENMNMNMRTD